MTQIDKTHANLLFLDASEEAATVQELSRCEVWDEISMQYVKCIEGADQLIRTLMETTLILQTKRSSS